MSVPSESLYQFGPFCLDGVRRTLYRDGERVPVTARTFDVLLALVERPGQTVEKDELLRIVWPDAVVEEANLTQQVFTIRRLLGTALGDAGYIVTVARRGYRFVAPVMRLPAAASHPSNRDAPKPGLQVIRLAMPLPAEAPLAPKAERVLTASPDGRTIVYVAAGSAGPRLYERRLDSVDAMPIPATEGAGNPFFSPDGEWIGFTSGRRLLKIPTRGGPPQTICEIQGEVRGATWAPTGAIVFAPGPASALWQVRRTGAVRDRSHDFDSRLASERIDGRTCCLTDAACCSPSGMPTQAPLTRRASRWRTLMPRTITLCSTTRPTAVVGIRAPCCMVARER